MANSSWRKYTFWKSAGPAPAPMLSTPAKSHSRIQRSDGNSLLSLFRMDRIDKGVETNLELGGCGLPNKNRRLSFAIQYVLRLSNQSGCQSMVCHQTNTEMKRFPHH